MPEENDKPRIVVDSDWKEQAQREKEKLAEQAHSAGSRQGEGGELPPADFVTHIASLATQAMIFMGAIANPLTGKADVDFDQARYIIDTLAVLRDKTKGNLVPEEQETLDNVLGELKLIWVQVSRMRDSGQSSGK